MIKYYYDIEQGTEEWFALRCGVVTASVVKILLTSTLKIANNDTVRTMAYEFAAQLEMKHVEESYQNHQMIRGHLEEELARDIYSENYAPVMECGFITKNIKGNIVGYSPDGLVGNDGLIEIKSRIQKHQVKTIVNGVVPAEYMMQMQTGLYVTEREWCDFVSYSNGMPFFVKRVYPDAEIQDKIAEAISLFYARVDEIRTAFREESAALVMTDRVALDFDDERQVV
jgi:predicted phage-related endonuclease